MRQRNQPQPPRGEKHYNRAPLSTYYRSKNEPGAASPFKRKEVKRNNRKLLFGLADAVLIFLLLAGLLYSLLLKPEPKLVINNTSYHTTAVYKSQIDPLFGGLKNRNKISFNESSVVQAIQKRFPEVQAAKVELPFFSQQPTVWLTISPPAFKLHSNNDLYVVDSQGTAVAKASELPAAANLITLDDQSGYQSIVGSQVLSSDAVDFINTIIAQSKHAKVPLSSLSLPPSAQELDLRTSDQSYYVKFYLGGDALIQSGQFLASRQKFAQEHLTPSQYLDVRVQGKIFYK